MYKPVYRFGIQVCQLLLRRNNTSLLGIQLESFKYFIK